MDQALTHGGEVVVANLDEDTRATFIVRTYTHLFGALASFTMLLVLAFKSGLAATIAERMLGTSWLLILGAFMVTGWLATRAAHRVESKAGQYLALAVYTVAEVLIFIPLLYIASTYHPGVIQSAATVSFAGFLGLTAVAFMTRQDFSFLGGLLRWAGVGAILLIGASLIFGFHLGTFFSVGMVVFAGAAILYDTSNVLHHYPEDRYISASLELFSSVALLFWYVLRIFMSSND